MTRSQQVAVGVGCVLLGGLGAALGLLVAHLWADHQLLHNMQSFLTSQIEQASRAAKTPPPAK
jgi:hypothetical protein